jgi:hypothetical protein
MADAVEFADVDHAADVGPFVTASSVSNVTGRAGLMMPEVAKVGSDTCAQARGRTREGRRGSMDWDAVIRTSRQRRRSSYLIWTAVGQDFLMAGMGGKVTLVEVAVPDASGRKELGAQIRSTASLRGD